MWPDHAAVLNNALTNFTYWEYLSLKPYPVEKLIELREAYRLFVEAPGFDFDEELFDSDPQQFKNDDPLSFCPDLECLNFMLRNFFSDLASIPLQTKFDFALFVSSRQPVNVTPSLFLQILGLDASDHRLATLQHTHRGMTTLHLIARCFRVFASCGRIIRDWFNLGIEILQNGADASSASVGGWCDTPLLNGLHPIERGAFPYTRSLKEILAMLRLWADMIYQAGIDLCQYGAREVEVWKSLPRASLKLSMDSLSRSGWVVVERLVYGPTPADWTLKVRPLEFPFYFRVLELRDPPGSFPRDSRVPTKIFWVPNTEEQDEGNWEEVTKCKIPCTTSTQPVELQRAIADCQQEPEEPFFIKTLDDTQDDAGAIALMQLRADRASRSRGTSASRSHSQPPYLFVRDPTKHIYFTRQRISRAWLPLLPLCPSDFRWNFETTYTVYDIYSGFRKLRDCTRIMANRPALAQQSREWQGASFLAWIAACQNDRPSTMLRENGHTGLPGCPQNCRKVHLEKLHVPEELKHYHPRSPWRPTAL